MTDLIILWRVEVLNARPVIVHTEIIKFEKREYWEPGTYTRLPFYPGNHPPKKLSIASGVWYNVGRHYTRRSAHKLPYTVCKAHGIMSTDIK